MINAVSMKEFMPDRLPEFLGLADPLIRHFHMTRKTDTGSRYLPRMKIMDTANAGDLFQEMFDLLKI